MQQANKQTNQKSRYKQNQVRPDDKKNTDR